LGLFFVGFDCKSTRYPQKYPQVMAWLAIGIAAFALIVAVNSLGLVLFLRARIAARLKAPNTMRLEVLEESFEGLLGEVQKLANSKKMQKVRAATEHVGHSGEPNAYTQPEEWKKFKRASLGMTIAKKESPNG
jgi:hypothetical protein